MRTLVALVVVASTLSASSALAVETLPLDQVRAGMTGVGRTVFEGTRIDDFRVTILGVLENAVGPHHSMILARLEGGPLAETGVMAGMSGSPVFIDGKLVGAVAYGFPFSKQTIAGITPIDEIIEATKATTPRAASLRAAFALTVSGPSLPLDRDTLVASLRRPLPVVPVSASAFQPLSGTLSPLPLPLVFAGFDPSTFEWARGQFAALGFVPVLAGGRTAEADPSTPALEPGAAVGVSLIEGDLDLSVSGTVTFVENDRIWAFGHPFFNLGPIQFPMKRAFVHSVFPSLYQSWKITSATDAVGTMDQDRATAIAGRIGPAPPMLPVSVRLTTSRGQQREYAFRVVEDETLSPVLAFASVLSALQSNERAFGTSTIRVGAEITLAGKPAIKVEDLFTEDQPAAKASALVAAPLAYLMANDFERIKVEKLEVEIDSQETVQNAVLERAWVERNGPVRPGTVVPLKLQLRTYRGHTMNEVIPIAVPATAPAGRYTLLVADASTLTRLEQREMRQSYVPHSLDQLIRALNGLRRNNRIYARLLRTDDGAIVSGEYLPSLPPSVLQVLGAAGDGIDVIPMRTASVWEFDLPIEYAVSGSRSLPLSVER